MALLGDAIQIRKNNLINIKDDTDYLIAGIQNYGKGVVIRRTVKGSELTMKKYQIIDENQLMWCKVDTKNGAFGVTKKEHIGALASTNMCLADIKKEKYLPVFIETLFAINPFHEWITKYSLGSTNRKYLTPIQLIERVEIPDLSIEQQKNFLLKVSALNESGLVIENQNQFAYLTKLRQAILQEAIEGKLTADWRKENTVRKGDPDYDAEALLEKIQAEKEKLIKSKELKKGKLPKDSKSFRDLLEIPKQWVWVKADEVYFITKLAGFEYTKYIVLLENGDIPVIRAQNVRPLNIDKTNLLYIDEETSEKLSRCALTKECLLVTFIGAGIGDVATFMEKERWHLAPNVAKMEPFKNCDHFINNKYSNYFLLSNSGQREVFKHIKATAQPSLSMETIRDIDFPLPPLAEQQAIVDRVEKFLSMVDELEKQVSERKEQSEQLMQAVLREAFEGGK